MYKKLDYYTEVSTVGVQKIVLMSSLAQYLYEIKEKIKLFDNEWDMYKEYTNPCEYIHTIVPTFKHAVSTYRPLSRSYFKMVEILTHFDILKSYELTPSLQSFHLAEGPGGFIEALVNGRRSVTNQDRYIGMTLIDETDKTIPSWKKSQHFMRNNPTVGIEYGVDGTGNLLSLNNFVDVVQRYGSSMDLVTADGGFDFSDDFNKQELNMLNLLYAQIAFAVCLQKRGGTFVLKMFDCFAEASVDLLYLLSSFYDKVYITKPQTSRYANSERYIVCMQFHFDGNTSFYPYLLSTFTNMCNKKEVRRFFDIPLPLYYLNRLEESNVVIGMNQIENIYSTITLMENKTSKKSRIEHLIKVNISKCVHWCMQHGVPILPSLQGVGV